MSIPLSSPWITQDDRDAVMRVLNTQHIALGPVLKEFEEKCASIAKVPHAVAMSSGTAVLSTMNRSLGWSEGDEVLTPSFSFVASANSILHVGAKPVFIDIDPVTWNMDPQAAKACLNDNTKAIQVVDIFGLPADSEAFDEMATQHDLDIVEDACEAVGALHRDGRPAGSVGRGGAWAFYPNKQLTTGEGGVLLTHDEELAQDCRSLMNQGRDLGGAWFGHKQLGYNHRMSDINAALGLSQLNRLPEVLSSRQQVASWYTEALEDCEHLELMPDLGRSWFVYVVKCRDASKRNSLMKYLRSKEIGCGSYFVSIHLMPFIQKLCGTHEGQLPVTEDLSKRTVALPFFTKMSSSQVSEVVEAVNAFFNS